MTDYLTPRANPYLPDLPDVNSIAALLQQPTQSQSGALYAQASAPASSSDSGSSTLALLSALQGQGKGSGGGQKNTGGHNQKGGGNQKSIGIKGLPDSVNNSVNENRRIAKALIARKYPQWNRADYKDLVSLWNRESGWNAKAENPTSTASGIPQMMLSVHHVPGNYQSSPIAQILTGLKYIKSRYSSPTRAWQHSQQTGWY